MCSSVWQDQLRIWGWHMWHLTPADITVHMSVFREVVASLAVAMATVKTGWIETPWVGLRGSGHVQSSGHFGLLNHRSYLTFSGKPRWQGIPDSVQDLRWWEPRLAETPGQVSGWPHLTGSDRVLCMTSGCPCTVTAYNQCRKSLPARSHVLAL